MSERVIFVNIAAVFIALGGCLIAHTAGIKYYVRRTAGASIVPAIVSTVEAIFLIVLSIVIVQI